MTAEIAIMNKHGVALAADSAVSIGDKKVYNSVNKLFSLSKSYPVGIMIYGNAMFMGIPWEIIIKNYRNNYLKNKNFAKLEEYASDFIEYIRNNYITDNESSSFYIQNRILTFLNTVVHIPFNNILQTTITELQAKDEKYSDILNVLKLKFNEFIIQLHQKSLSLQLINGISESSKNKFIDENMELVINLIENIIDKEQFIENSKNLLIETCFNYILSTEEIESYSGIVITGFGNNEIYPRLISYKIHGIICNQFFYTSTKATEVGNALSASINPFAQHEMVDTIMTGIDPNLMSQITSLLNISISQISQVIQTNYNLTDSDSSLSNFKNSVSQLNEFILKAIENFKRINYINPILDSVESLPPSELGIMAETLINLTSFKRRVTLEKESVGGPIDVAIITKGDGFVWIKRKHYFDANLNSQYFINQSRSNHE